MEHQIQDLEGKTHLSYQVAVIQLITSYHKTRITTRIFSYVLYKFHMKRPIAQDPLYLIKLCMLLVFLCVLSSFCLSQSGRGTFLKIAVSVDFNLKSVLTIMHFRM